MPFIIADRVRETSTTVGTGSIALGGAVLGFQTFDAVLDTGDTTFYVAADQGGPNWEVGIGTFTAPSTLARTTILSSSNGGSIVNFGVGTKEVFISLPASKTNVEDQPNLIEVNSSSAALRITQTGSGNALLVEDSANPDSSPFVVDASGNVGVGTTTPTAPLDVNGNVAITGTARRITGDFTNATISNRAFFQTSTTNGATTVNAMPNGTGVTTAMRVYNSSDPNNAAFGELLIGSDAVRLGQGVTGTGTAIPITFLTGGSERMRLDTSGNLGLGTSSPGARLDVAVSGTATATNVLRAFNSTDGAGTGAIGIVKFGSTAGAYGPYVANNVGVNAAFTDFLVGTETFHPLEFYTWNIERMRITADGNVGIGTSSPQAKLVASNAGAAGLEFFTNYPGGGVGTYIQSYNRSGAAYVNTAYDAAQHAFFTNGSERMRLDAAGNLGIGTSSIQGRFNVAGGRAFFGPNGELYAIGVGFNQTRVSGGQTYYMGATDSATPDLVLSNSAGSEAMRVTNAGNVGIGMTDPGGRNSRLAVNGNISLFSTEQNFYPYYFSATNHAYISSATNGDMTFGTGTGGVAERARITTGGDFLFNSGYGSVATAFGCRAWVNFNGTGTVAIRASGNVSSITDNGTGNYTVNFTTAMPDSNYSVQVPGSTNNSFARAGVGGQSALATSSVIINTSTDGGSPADRDCVTVAIFR